MFIVSCARDANAAAKGDFELRKLLNLSFALALVAGLFAGSLATAGAISPVYGPEIPGNPTIFFPFVYNGTMLNGMGPFNGAVTIQNQDNLPINVKVTDAGGAALKSFTLNPRASKVYSASALGVADGGGGVIATASFTNDSVNAMLNTGMCVADTQYTETITKGAPNGTDTLAHHPVDKNSTVTVTQTTDANGVALGTPITYTEGTDFKVNYVTGAIDWSLAGAEPPTNAQYTVTYTTAVCPDPVISGVEKHVSPSQNGQANSTSSAQTTVDGYTAVSGCDMALAQDQATLGCAFDTGLAGISLPELDLNNQSRWILPIAQTNTGWNSIIHVTNVSGNDGVGVSALFYAANGQGNSGPSTQLFSTTLNKGETMTYDLTADGNFPAGTVGSVWIDGDAGIVASVDRVKSETNMALTNVAQPRNDNAVNYLKLVGKNPTIKYAPLVFKDYNNRNTGINVANLSSNTNTVTVTYYNYLDNSTSQDTKSIPPRGMEYFYMPGSGSDIGLGNNSISSAVVSGSEPLVAAVDEVKYTGGNGAGNAMSYPAQYGAYAGPAYDTTQFPALTDLFQNYINGFAGGRVFYQSQLNLPLVQKGNADTGLGDTSGINLFNADPNAGVTAFVQFEDTAGIPVAPTNNANDAENPIQVPMGALASHTIYTMQYSELPEGFNGSAVVGVVYNSAAQAQANFGIAGPLVGVSNNVNYDVSGDGSSVFNMNIGYGTLPTTNPGCYYPAFPNSDLGVQECNPFPAP